VPVYLWQRGTMGMAVSLCHPASLIGALLPEEGVLQVQQITRLGACLVHLGHNTDVVALSVWSRGRWL
jgi:hypothetical protein